MDGRDLIVLAERLCRASSLNADAEAIIRTSAGRSYYGAFHLVVEMLSRFNISIPTDHTAHDLARNRLKDSRVPAAVEAANLLHSLRRDRNEADYDLGARRWSSVSTAEICYEEALALKEKLDECFQEPTLSQLKKHFSN